jgi:hypothetical protein
MCLSLDALIYGIWRNDFMDKYKVLFSPINPHYSEERTMDAVGQNTGNIVFVEAFKEQMSFDSIDVLDNLWVSENKDRKNVCGIMPASNFLSPETKWIVNLIPFIEAIDMRFTFVGLGAQAKLSETPHDVVDKLSKEQNYFYKLISERAVSIGVRGEFTAECLNLMNIKNVEVIGCPSIYKYKEFPQLPIISTEKILYTKTYRNDKTEKFIYGQNVRLIAQTESNICPNCPSKIFYNYDEWNKYIEEQKFTFAFGTRFHGNMMALRNNIPTLWIVHDWRTLELAQYLELPHLNFNDSKLEKMNSIDELLEYCDYSEFYKKYGALQKKYKQFLNKNLL